MFYTRGELISLYCQNKYKLRDEPDPVKRAALTVLVDRIREDIDILPSVKDELAWFMNN